MVESFKHATCSSVKALKTQIINYNHIYNKRGANYAVIQKWPEYIMLDR